MKLSTWLLSLVLCITAAASAGGPPAEWSVWRGPTRDGVFRDEAAWSWRWPPEGPPLLWKVPIGIGYASFAVSEGRVYTVGHIDGEDVIFCLDAATGRTLWTVRYPQELVPIYNPGGPNATPAVDGPWVYVLSKQGLLSCLDKRDGRLRWRVDVTKAAGAPMPRWGFASTPVILGDRLFLNANTSGVAVDKRTGEIVWSSPPGECGYATPLPITSHGTETLAVFGTDSVFAVRQSDGAVLWRTSWPTRMGENSADLLFKRGRLYVSSWWGMGAAVFDLSGEAPRSKEPLWQNKAFQNHIAGPVLHEGFLYGFDGPVHRRREPGALRCVEFKTGRTVWSRPEMKGSLILAGGMLIILTNEGSLVVADATPEGYHERARVDGLGHRTWPPPLLHHGRLYCRDANGWGLCFDLVPARDR